MKLLYIFPHPDDESFGPAAPMARQIRAGHEVYLHTLTKGEATKVRHDLGVSREEMGEIRFREMLQVERVLGLSGMKVEALPDSGLKELDPRKLEEVVRRQMEKIRPDIVVTYPVHGISGFHDHLVTHAIVKRSFLALKDHGGHYLKRLAFYTLRDRGKDPFGGEAFPVRQSMEAEIDCVMEMEEQDLQALHNALDRYKTYQKTIERSGIREKIGYHAYFEIFGEEHAPPLSDLTEGL